MEDYGRLGEQDGIKTCTVAIPYGRVHLLLMYNTVSNLWTGTWHCGRFKPLLGRCNRPASVAALESDWIVDCCIV